MSTKPRYTEGKEEEFQKLKKVILECQPFSEGCASIVCVKCFRFLVFPSGSHKIQCGNCNALCSSVMAKCVSCDKTMKVPLSASEVQCPNCQYCFKPVAKMRVLVPEFLANEVPPPLRISVIVDENIMCQNMSEFVARVIISKPLSINISAWEKQSGANFHRVSFYKVRSDTDEEVKLDSSRTIAELALVEGDTIKIIAASNTDNKEGPGKASATSSGHDFQTVQFNTPTNCCICKEFIWGVYHQGKKCVRCSIPVHHRCANQCSSMCDAARRQLFGIMDFGDGDDDSGDDDHEKTSDAVLAVPVDDPQAFMSACKEDTPPECDPNAMSKLAQLAEFSDEQIAELWSKYDKDGSGVLEEGEAKQFLADCVMSFGTKMDPSEKKNQEVLDRLLRRLDTNENGVVEWDEFYMFFQAQKDVAFLKQFAGSQKEFTTEQLYEMWANYDIDGSGELEVDEVLRLLGDITQTDPKSLQAGQGKNPLSSFLKSGEAVSWDVFYSVFVPLIQDAVKNAKK